MSSNSNAGAYDGVPPVTTGTANPPYSVFNEKDPANTNTTLQYQSITCMPQYRGNSFKVHILSLSYASKITSRTERLLGLLPSISRHSAVQYSPPLRPACSDSLRSNSPRRTLCLVLLVMLVPVVQLQGVPLAVWVNHRRNRRGDLVRSTRLSNRPSSRPNSQRRVASDPSTRLSNLCLRILACSGAAVHLGRKINRWVVSGVPVALERIPMQDLLVFLDRPIPRSNNLPLPVCLHKISQLVVHLVGVHLVQIQLDRNHPYSGRPNNNQQPVVVLACLDPSNNRALKVNLSKALPDCLEINQDLDRLTQPRRVSRNREDYLAIPGPNSLPPGCSVTLGGGGGLFGNAQQQGTQQQAGQPSAFGLFGNKTTTPTTGGGLFGNNTAGQTNTTPGSQQTSLFGNTFGQSASQPTNNSFGGGTGIFGRASAPTGGVSLSSTQPLGSSMLGSTLGTSALGGPGANSQGLQASIAQPIATNLPIFSLLPSSNSQALETSTKKKVNLFDSVRTPTSRSIAYQPVQTRLRGYTSTTSSPSLNNGSTLSLTTGKPNALSLTLTGSPGKVTNGSEPFGTSLLKADSRASFKKLVLDKKVDAADLLKRSGASPSPKRPTFNASLAIAAREKEKATLPTSSSSRMHPSNERGTTHALLDSQALDESPSTPQEGDYCVEPSISTLSKLGYEELAQVKDLVVKRIGFGDIRSLEPVDLTTLTKLSDLLGEQVRFDEMECSVYPDSDGVDKPPPGNGLNVHPIKDEKHPSAVKHLKRLKSMKDTTFENFDFVEGKWTFTVDHF